MTSNGCSIMVLPFLFLFLLVGIIPVFFYQNRYVNLRMGFENAQHVVPVFVIWIRKLSKQSHTIFLNGGF